MSRRSLENHHIRKLSQAGTNSYAVVLPIEIVKELGWKLKQKVTVTRQGDSIVINDWQKDSK